jgi:hypothetical protein
MARVFAAAAVAAFLTLCVAGCAAAAPQATRSSSVASPQSSGGYERVNADTTLLDVIDHPAFEGFGRFLFPTGRGMPDGRKALRDAGDLLPYHRHVDLATTVDVVNSLMGSVERRQTVFYDIYTDEEKAADPSKKDTGLFFFRGRPNAPFGMVSAGAASPTWAPFTRASPTRWS